MTTPLVLWHMGKAEIVNENCQSFKEAVKQTVEQSPGSTAFCSFGSGRQLFQYYVDRPVIFITDINDLRSFTQKNSEYACFCIPRLINKTDQDQIDLLKALEQNNEHIQYQEVSVFLQKKKVIFKMPKK